MQCSPPHLSWCPWFKPSPWVTPLQHPQPSPSFLFLLTSLGAIPLLPRAVDTEADPAGAQSQGRDTAPGFGGRSCRDTAPGFGGRSCRDTNPEQGHSPRVWRQILQGHSPGAGSRTSPGRSCRRQEPGSLSWHRAASSRHGNYFPLESEYLEFQRQVWDWSVIPIAGPFAPNPLEGSV